MTPIGRTIEAMGLVEPVRRMKRQDVADAEMANLLATRYGLSIVAAQFLVEIGRDGAPQVVTLLHGISAHHRLGWFGEEP